MPEEKDLISYCGIYCGDCFAHRGVGPDLARDLREELRQVNFDRIAQLMSKEPFFAVYKDYPQCYEVLGALAELRCEKACRGGGGPPACKIRECCHDKGIDGCWQCDEFETCENLEILKISHLDGHLKNLRKLKKAGVNGFLKGKRYW